MWKFTQQSQIQFFLSICLLTCAGLAGYAMGDDRFISLFLSKVLILSGHPSLPGGLTENLAIDPENPTSWKALLLVGMLLSDRFAWLKLHQSSSSPSSSSPSSPNSSSPNSSSPDSPQSNAPSLEQFFEIASDGFVSVDREWRYTYVNRRAEQLLGKPRQQLLGQNVWQLFPELRETEAYRAAHRVMTEQTAIAYEEYYPWLNCWFSVHIYPSPIGIAVYFLDITEKKQYEQQLHFQLQLLSQIEDAVVAVDQGERITYWNNGATRLYGLSAAAVLGRPLTEVLQYEWLNPADQQIASASLATEGFWRGENTHLTANGDRIVVEASVTLLKDDAGNSSGMIAVLRDVTVRKHMEAQLQESQTRLTGVLESVQDVLWSRDVQSHRLIYTTPSVEQLCGLPMQDFLQQPDLWLQCIHPEDYARLSDLDRIVFEQRSMNQFEIEYRICRPDGELRWVRDRAYVVRDDQGVPIRVDGITTDITESKRAAAALRQSEERLRLAVNSLPDVFAIYDAERRFQYVNEAGLRRVNLTLEEMIGKRDEELWQEETTQPYLPTLLKTVETRQMQSVECAFILPHTETFTMIVKYLPLLDEQGNLQQILAFTFDITDRVRAETERNQASQEIQRLNLELEQRVLERTAQLQTIQTELQSLNDDLERRVIQRTIELELTNRLLEQEVADRKLSEARYRSLALASAEAVWTTEATGEVTDAQPSWEHLSGQKFPDYLEAGWLERVHPDDRARVTAGWVEAVATRSTFESEHQVQIADGSYRYFSVRAVPVFDESGNLLEWVGVHTDVTEAKAAERALRTSEQRFRRLAESNIFGVAFGSFSGSILDANDYFLKMTGYTRSDLEAGRVRWLDMTPAEYLPLDWNAGAELRQCGVATPFEKEYIRKDGSRVPLLIGSALMNEPYDEQTEIVSFYVDLTARKRAESERERLLAQEQTARQQAEAANRIKDEFLAVLSHELRSPLNPILGWTRLLRTRSFDATTTDRALETIERNAKLQTQLIEDLLDVSRILRGKMSLQMSAADLVGIVESAIETVQMAAETKSIQIDFLPLPALYQVMGDTARLQQIVWNLLSNAIKFTPNGGKVDVRLERIDGGVGSGEWGDREQGSGGAGEQGENYSSTHSPIHSYALLTVTDTGKGIHPDFLPHVFEYFRQADSSITRTFGGLGLGLAIVRHLVELHGGTVSVDSAGEGQGATFTVRLPLIQADALLLAEPALPPMLPREGLLRDVRVLAVDDEADMREYVNVLLEEAGATVLLASSAKEALTMLMQTAPDVLISDIGMPQFDGYTLLRQIRQLSPKQGGQVPAIALTAYASEYDHQKAMAAGFHMHLSKPIDPDHLVQAIRQLLDIQQFS